MARNQIGNDRHLARNRPRPPHSRAQSRSGDGSPEPKMSPFWKAGARDHRATRTVEAGMQTYDQHDRDIVFEK